METKELMETTELLLKGMGEDAVAVSKFLKAKGIQGMQESPSDDPVARYIKDELGIEDVANSEQMVWINSNGQYENGVPRPDAVDTFTWMFDEGEFPDLIDRSAGEHYLLKPAELAAVLAGLRLLQPLVGNSVVKVAIEDALQGVTDVDIMDITSNGHSITPLTVDQIDSLCERLNPND